MAKMTARKARPKIEEAGLATWRRALSNTKRIKELEELVQVQQETIVALGESIAGVQKTVTRTVKLLKTVTQRIEALSDRDTGPRTVCNYPGGSNG